MPGVRRALALTAFLLRQWTENVRFLSATPKPVRRALSSLPGSSSWRETRSVPHDRDADKLRPDTNNIASRAIQAALGLAPKPEPSGEPGCREARAEGREEGR